MLFMTNPPKSIIRIDDGAEFLLNPNGTYSLSSLKIKGDHYEHEYSYELLMEDYRYKGKFKVREPSDNLNEMYQSWIRNMKLNRNDGHGNEE